MGKKAYSLDSLTSIMERLRSPRGCPWDREQTLKSLTPFIIEEAYEVVSAIDSGNSEHIKEELGDLLFQIIFAAEIEKERGSFTIEDVIRTSAQKMIRRHAHVFGNGEPSAIRLRRSGRSMGRATTSKEVLKKWEEIKKKEKGGKKGALSDVPEAFPALIRAHKISKKAGKLGFDWKDAGEVMEKVAEEFKELKNALSKKDKNKIEEELGDVFFTLVNLGRFVEVNPEEALRKTIGKFITRFHYIEKKLEEKGSDPSSATMKEMERLWNQAKTQRKKSNITRP